MKTRKTGLSVFFLAVLFATLPQMASATLYGGSWSAAPNISDQADDSKNGSSASDITGVWYVQSGGDNYFRMDLAGSISVADYADKYVIYISATPITGFPPSGGRVAMLAGDFDGELYTGFSFKNFSGIAVSPIGYSMAPTSGGTGTTLEWSVPVSALSGTFYYMGATIKGSTVVDQTSATPIPNAAWLLGSGLLGLVGLKRRRNNRAGVDR